MAFLQQQLNALAIDLSIRRRCVCGPASVGYKSFIHNYIPKANEMVPSEVTFMNSGSNHAAVFFSHSCPFRSSKLWRKPL